MLSQRLSIHKLKSTNWAQKWREKSHRPYICFRIEPLQDMLIRLPNYSIDHVNSGLFEAPQAFR